MVGFAGSPICIVHVDLTLTGSKVKIKVIELLKFQRLYFSRSVSSAILAWSSKLMVDYDIMGPSLQRVRAQFLNFLLIKLSHDFKLHRVSIVQDFQRAIFPYYWRLVIRSDMLVVLYVLCIPSPNPRSRSRSRSDDRQPPFSVIISLCLCMYLPI